MSVLDRYGEFRRPVYLVAGARFVNTFGSGLVYPFATLYFHLVVGIPFTLVGIGLLANNVATALGTLVGGYLSDRHGRKPVMVASMALAAPTLAAYAFVRNAAGFVTVASAVGLALGLFAPAANATVADVTDPDGRERAYALLKVASNAGFGTGFVAGGLLYGVAKTAVFLVDGASSAVVALILLVGLASTHEGRETTTGVRQTLGEWRRSVTHPTILALAALNVGFAVMYAQMQSTVPVFAETQLGLSSEQIGTLYVLNPLVIVLFQLPIVDHIQGWRRTRGLALSAGFWGASFLALLAVYASPWILGVALVGGFLVCRTIGEILHAPLLTALGSDVGTVDTRGSHLSVLEVAKRLGFGIGPVIGGVFFDYQGVPLAGTPIGDRFAEYGAVPMLWISLIAGCALLAVALVGLETRIAPAINGQPQPGD